MNKEKIFEQAAQLRCQGDTKKAFLEYKKLAKDSDIKTKVMAISGMALCKKMEMKSQEANRLKQKALKILEKNKMFDWTGGMYRDLAINTYYQRDFTKAEKYFKKSFDGIKLMKVEKAKTAEKGITIAKFGYMRLLQNRLGEAERKIKEGLKLVEKVKHDFWTLTAKMHLAQVYNAKKEFKKALEITEDLKIIALKSLWWHRFSQILIVSAETKIGLKNKDSGEADLVLAKYIADHFDSVEVQKEILKDIERVKQYTHLRTQKIATSDRLIEKWTTKK